jgi:hypothetical protein
MATACTMSYRGCGRLAHVPRSGLTPAAVDIAAFHVTACFSAHAAVREELGLIVASILRALGSHATGQSPDASRSLGAPDLA